MHFFNVMKEHSIQDKWLHFIKAAQGIKSQAMNIAQFHRCVSCLSTTAAPYSAKDSLHTADRLRASLTNGCRNP